MVEEIGVELAVLDLPDLPEDELARSVQKLEDLTLRDLEKQEREKAANSLEAFIFETQDKLYQPEYQEVSTEEQREEISGKLSATSTWLEDEGFGATTVMLKDKLAELRKLCQGLFFGWKSAGNGQSGFQLWIISSITPAFSSRVPDSSQRWTRSSLTWR